MTRQKEKTTSFSATFNTISVVPDSDAPGVKWQIQVTFEGSATRYSEIRTYTFPAETTEAAVEEKIEADARAIKAALGRLSNLKPLERRVLLFY
jgi:hypothetical protein